MAVQYLNALTPSLSRPPSPATLRTLRRAAFTVDGHANPWVTAAVLSAVAEELGVAAVLTRPTSTGPSRLKTRRLDRVYMFVGNTRDTTCQSSTCCLSVPSRTSTVRCIRYCTLSSTSPCCGTGIAGWI